MDWMVTGISTSVQSEKSVRIGNQRIFVTTDITTVEGTQNDVAVVVDQVAATPESISLYFKGRYGCF